MPDTVKLVSSGAFLSSEAKSMAGVPAAASRANSSIRPSRKPASPTRLVIKAFFPAEAFSGSSYQKPINR